LFSFSFPFSSSLFRKKKDTSPTVYTEESCSSCGEKVKRLFQESDYIYKEAVMCKKCSASTLITAIYGEYPRERKEGHRENE
jgi:DNA-directed RNA polymerase subunit RPC12/RpoP